MDKSLGLDLNFTNPEPISTEEFGAILDFNLEVTTKAGEEEEEKDQAPEVGAEEVVDTPTLEIADEPKEETPVINYEHVINLLADKGYIKEAYEGFSEEEISEETLIKLLEHNIEKQKEEEFLGFIGERSELVQRIIKYDYDSKGKDLDSYLRTLVEETNIKSLDPANEYDQEKIIRQWYRTKEGFNNSEVEEKISELKDAGLLEKEAKRIKPKLDDEAQRIAEEIEQQQAALKEMEDSAKSDFTERVLDSLKKGKVKDITLSKEEATQMYQILTSDEVEVTIHGGKKTQMTPLEYLVFFNKYDKRGSIENLMLATLLMIKPEKFEEAYRKSAEKKEVETFVKQHKYNNTLKKGEVVDQASKTQQKDEPRWRFKIPGQ